MDLNEMPAVPCCPSDSPTGLETGAPWGIELGPKRAVSRCARCYNHGFTDQIKDQEHSCLFQACECHKCAFFSEHHSVLPAESALKRKQGAPLKKRLAHGLKKSEASPPKAHSPVKKLTIQAGVLTGKENIMSQLEAHPPLCNPQGGKRSRSSADWTGPKIFVSVLDSSSLEDATNNFSFQEDPQDSCPAQHMLSSPALCHPWSCPTAATDPGKIAGSRTLAGAKLSEWEEPKAPPSHPGAPEASDQDSVSASEWQRKLEAAEALLILRESPQAPSGSISLLQPCVAAVPAGDRGPQPSSPSLRPRPASSISLPIGHLGCISLLS